MIENDNGATFNSMNVCQSCGEKSAKKELRVQKFLYGDGADQVELEAIVPVWSCENCDEQFTDEEGEIARHEAVCNHLGRLTPRAIRKLREDYNLSQEQFSKLTEIGLASIKRWEVGSIIQNASTDRYLRLLGYWDNIWRLSHEMTSKDAAGEPKFKTQISNSVREKSRRFELTPVNRKTAELV